MKAIYCANGRQETDRQTGREIFVEEIMSSKSKWRKYGDAKKRGKRNTNVKI